MKKLSLILMALLLCIALVACGGGDETTEPTQTGDPSVVDPAVTDPAAPGTDTPEDTHIHTNKVLEPVASTCTAAGLTDGIVCTDCGKTVVAQAATPLAPHAYENGKCKTCGAEAKASEGLLIVAQGLDGYVVEGIGTCTDTQIVIPETYEGQPVIGIANGAFANNEAIVQVVIPASAKRIGNNAFERCTNLASVSIADGVETIGEKAFLYCTALEAIEIPDSVTTISTGAFMACYNLTEATIGAGLKKLPNDLFFECYSLEVIDIFSKVEEIGGWAFFDCDLLTTITFAGTDADWNKIAFGNYWDENSGAYNVSCAGGKSVHKHVYGDWYETGKNCEMARKCTKCSVTNTKLEHDTANAKWEFTSEGVVQNCTKCKTVVNGYMKNEYVLKIDFEKPISEEIKDYPFFSIVDANTIANEKSGDRTVGHIKGVTWFDYDKKAFENLSYYSITFDMMVADKGDYARDNSVVSFVPGTKGGKKADGASQGWNWQVKYVPVLDKVATVALNGTDIPYKTLDAVPADKLDKFTSASSADLKEGQWITIDIVCDIEAKKSYVFADGKPIGSVSTFDYQDPKYKDAFSLRFCDVSSFGTRLDNFCIQAMTAD